MKKLYLLSLLLPLWSVSSAAVQVKSISTDYANKRVTFALSWAAGTRNATHLSKVWVFVDYTTVTNPNITGAWQRATVVSATATNGTVSGNTGRGFYLQGTDGAFSSTVTVTLSGVPAKFNWCAYATDYPPNAAAYNNGTYTLKGTMPFTVNGTTTITSDIYSGTINTITDATGCPGCIGRDAIKSAGTCCQGLTLVGGYCRDLAADGASTFTGCGIEIKATDAGRSYWAPNTLCPAGWRWPTSAELACMCPNKAAIGNFILTSGGACGSDLSCCDYWSSTDAGGGNAYYMYFCNCNIYGTNQPYPYPKNANNAGVRCVR